MLASFHYQSPVSKGDGGRLRTTLDTRKGTERMRSLAGSNRNPKEGDCETALGRRSRIDRNPKEGDCETALGKAKGVLLRPYRLSRNVAVVEKEWDTG
jgi:hypothetical protein